MISSSLSSDMVSRDILLSPELLGSSARYLFLDWWMANMMAPAPARAATIGNAAADMPVMAVKAAGAMVAVLGTAANAEIVEDIVGAVVSVAARAGIMEGALESTDRAGVMGTAAMPRADDMAV